MRLAAEDKTAWGRIPPMPWWSCVLRRIGSEARQEACVGIASVVLVLCVGASAVHGCEAVTVLRNYQLFHGATEVYKGKALSSDFRFSVTRTWRGMVRQVVELPWAARRAMESCSEQQPVRVGEHYLLVVYCGLHELTSADRVECRSYAEHLGTGAERLVAFEQGLWVQPKDVASKLQMWADGSLSGAKLGEWVKRNLSVAMIDDEDWVTVCSADGEAWEVSRTGAALELLENLFSWACDDDEEPDPAKVNLKLRPLIDRLLFSDLGGEPEWGRDLEALEDSLGTLCRKTGLARREPQGSSVE